MAIAPPHDTETERQLLGSLLIRSNLIPDIDSHIKSEDFYLESHRLVYSTILELHRKEVGDIDAVQITQRLSDLSRLEQAGGAEYVLRLAQDVMAPGNALHHSRRVRSLSLRRKLMEASSQIITLSVNPVEDEAAFLRQVEDSVLRITNQSFSSGIISTGELKEDFKKHIDNLVQTQGRFSGVETHFRDFDHLTSGLKDGELIILAARPGLGKTTFALNVAANVAIQNNQPVLLFSLEMSEIELMMRLACARSQISHEHLKRGQIPPHRQKDLLVAIDEICKAPLFIDSSGDLTIWDCLARTRKFKIECEQQGKKLGLVVVDYLQLMSDPDARKLGRQHEVATISRCLKQLARIATVPLIAVSQMNRSVEQRRGDSARPQLSDLRESGAIEQDADIVMFIHHDVKDDEEELSEEELEKQGTVEMVIAKHRNGPIGGFRLIFRPQINQFANTENLSAAIR